MAETEISQFLTHLARDGQVAASTQNQALSAILFLYKEVLRQEIGWLENVERAKHPVRLPVVLSRDEVHKLFARLHGVHRQMAGLLYGSGLRLMECIRLRVKDVDFGYARITVRDVEAKGCHENPKRGSKSLLLESQIACGTPLVPATSICPVVGLKLLSRFRLS